MSTNATLQIQPTDNTLINGRMPYNCSLTPRQNDCNPNAPFSQFRVQAGKTYKLRLINAGAGSLLGFSIDNHVLTIVANDFVDLEPYNTTMVLLGVSLFGLRILRACVDLVSRLAKGQMYFSRRRQTDQSGCAHNCLENSALDRSTHLLGLLFW